MSVCMFVVSFMLIGSKAEEEVDLKCGAYCLFTALSSLDIAVGRFEDFEKKLGKPTPYGYSMQQLEEAAKSFGAFTLGVETSLEQICRRQGRFACLALLDNKHYVCISDVSTRGEVEIVDPPDVRLVDRNAFGSLWDGKALLVSRQELKPMSTPNSWGLALGTATILILIGAAFAVVYIRCASRKRANLMRAMLLLVAPFMFLACSREAKMSKHDARIAVQPQAINLGDVINASRDGTVSGEFILENNGQNQLQIFGVNASCGCTVVETPPNSLASGESTPIKFSIKLKNETGKHTSNISILSSDPSSPTIKVPVSWSELPMISFDTNLIELGWIENGGEEQVQVGLQRDSSIRREDLVLSCASQSVHVSWTPLESKSLGKGNRTQDTVRVSIKGGGQQGPQSAEIRVRDKQKRFMSTLIVNWRAGLPITISPQALYRSGLKPKQKVNFQIILSTNDGKNVRVKKILIDDHETAFSATPIESSENKSMKINFEVESGPTPGISRKSLALFLEGDHEGSVAIPLNLVSGQN